MNMRHLQYNWWKYVIVISLSVLIWYGVFDALAKPKDNERCRILYVGEHLEQNALQEKIQEQLPRLTDQNLKEIKVTVLPVSDYQLLQARCYDYDILIFEKPYLQEHTGQWVAGEAFDPALSDDGISWYTESVDGKTVPFGVFLPEESLFFRFYSGTEPCVLMVSPHSVNLGDTDGQDAAKKVVEYLLGC